MENFKNKTVIVTGGSRGIGKTICIEFAKLGANVIFNYARNHNEAKKTKEEIIKYGVACEVIKCNLNDPEQINNFFTEVESKYKSIDILINNAASGVNKKSYELEIKHWDWTYNINAKAPWLLSIKSSKLMKNGGSIINISSLGSQKVLPNYFLVGTSKASLETITKYLAVELADKNIAVNCVTPAAAKTRIFDQITQEHIDYMLSKIPRNRFVKVEELAAMVSWMVSEENSFTTGAVFDVSGGRATY